jgi:CRISPR type III-A-associated RAMP protein Csm5
MKVLLKTLTPVHIGNGEKLSPYSDYVFDEQDGIVYYLDHQRIESFFQHSDRGDELLERFVQFVMAGKGENHAYTIKDFFANHRIDYRTLAREAVKTSADINNEEIHEHVKTASQLYIPGSSLKGAIRTCLLFSHRLQRGYSLDAALADLRVRERRENVHGADVFGKYGNDLLKHLHLSDTTTIPPEHKAITKTHRYHFKKKQFTLPVTVEAIPENIELEFSLQCKARTNLHHIPDHLSYLFQQDDHSGEKTILAKVNDFSAKIIEKEINVLSRLKAKETEGLLAFYLSLKSMTEEFAESSCGAVLRVGSGKTYFDNTISFVFSEQELRTLLKQLKLSNDSPFPVTRAVTTQHQQAESVMGWVSLHIAS